MATAERNIGSQTERQSALSKELLGILAIGATLLVGQVSAFSLLRAEIADLRGDVDDLRSEMYTEIGSLRDEMHTELSGVRGEISGLRDEVSGLRERMARVETHVEIIREDVAFLSGRRESPARSEPGP